MAKTWYPVIDYLICGECGACIANCPHGVYMAAKAPSPVVTDPEACIDHCHGCGNRCPAGAITYTGDDTGWTPPNGTKEPGASGLFCGRDHVPVKKVIVEYLYLDLQTCERCIGTDTVLDEVMLTLTPALQFSGYKVEYHKIQMETAELSERFKFLSSPTIRVNGRDICGSVEENRCGCCSDISGSEVDCRVFAYNGESFEVPPKEMLAEAILKTVFGLPESVCPDNNGYKLPDNLRAFFEGKIGKSSCSCGGNCRS